MRTYTPKPGDVEKNWYVIDATDVILGRLAAQAATLLRGKHKPQFAPNEDCGDYVVIINADKVALTNGKADKKFAYRHSGHPGGLTAVSYRELLVQLVGEVVLQGATVQRPLAGAGTEAHAGDGLLAATQAGAGGGDGLAAPRSGLLGLGGVAGGGVLLVQRVDVDSGLSHDMSFACRGVPSAGALTGRPG